MKIQSCWGLTLEKITMFLLMLIFRVTERVQCLQVLQKKIKFDIIKKRISGCPKVVDAPFLESFMVRLGGALSNLI